MDTHPRIAVIGAGAAGCFCAAQLGLATPGLCPDLFEAGRKPLAKVAVTGGGRCNLTNTFEGVERLEEVYPRGARLMRHALAAFSWKDCCAWFESRGVPLTLRDAPCVFPASQDAMDVVRALEKALRQAGVRIHTESPVRRVEKRENGYFIRTGGEQAEGPYEAVVVTTGGSPKAVGLSFLEGLELELVSPVPSLFTFCLKDTPEGGRSALTALAGTVVDEVRLSLEGTPFCSEGILLVTDWGLSGPATLKLSAYAARQLAENRYQGVLGVRWCGSRTDGAVRGELAGLRQANPRRQTGSVHPAWGGLSARLWSHLLRRAGISPERPWAETGMKSLNKLAETLTNDRYLLAGKGRFKEEFVTCGGIALPGIDPHSLESRKHPGLYFAGEVLDVDGVTGGFNLQAAWSTGMAVARALTAAISAGKTASPAVQP